MNESTTDRFDWSNTPTVLVQRPACPFCGEEHYEKQRTRTTEEDHKLKFCQCTHCSKFYRIRLDSPKMGLDVIWPA